MAKQLSEEEFAKLTPEQREVILEERKRKEKEKKKREKKRKKETFWSLFPLFLFCGIFSGGLFLSDKFSKEAQIEKYVEECNFAEARKVLARMDPTSGSKKEREAKREKISKYTKIITQAEITFFIDEGDFSKAYDSASANDALDFYQATVLNRIPAIYDKEGVNALAKTLSTIVFPPSYSFRYDSFVADYNTRLTSIIAIIEADGKKDEARLLRQLLKK